MYEAKEEIYYPLKVEYNSQLDELIVCTTRDVRFYDLQTGRIKKIFGALVENPDDDITVFKIVEQNKKFIIGDHRGNQII